MSKAYRFPDHVDKRLDELSRLHGWHRVREAHARVWRDGMDRDVLLSGIEVELPKVLAKYVAMEQAEQAKADQLEAEGQQLLSEYASDDRPTARDQFGAFMADLRATAKPAPGRHEEGAEQ